MAKMAKTVYVCQECGYESPKWMGQCICGAWNSMFEEKITGPKGGDKRRRSGSIGGVYVDSQGTKPPSLADITSDNEQKRIDTGIGELNRVLGGGLVPGSLTLISGEPGIGKSTIIMQAAASIADGENKVLYVSGEESEEQIKMRADRICGNASSDLFILAETNMDIVAAVVEELKPGFVIIDSIQTMYMEELDSAPGSVSQVRACGNELMRIGKTKNIPVFIVAHVTKSGDLAGPKIVEHLVDCVLIFSGERNRELRILRAFKNRFGTTSEIGAFEMAEQGLIEIEDLSRRFLEDMDETNEGSMVTAIYEGTRPLLLEVQALTAKGGAGFARRTALGIDNGRLSMIIAVLERKTGIFMMDQDVYVNIVGGIRPEGTSTDLAVALAIYSTYREVHVPRDILAIGEVGLTGDLRPVRHADKIIKEAERMGFKKIILPKTQGMRFIRQNKYEHDNDKAKNKIEIIPAKNISEAIAAYS